MPAAKTKYHNAKCSECGKTPDTHTIKMEKPHGFKM